MRVKNNNFSIHDTLILGFPLFLILFELLFRTLFDTDASSFIGPALASSGLSLLVSNTKPKPVEISSELAEQLKETGHKIRYAGDDNLITLTWVLILIGLMVWFWTCVISQKEPDAIVLWIMPKHFFVGMMVYVTGVVCSAWKHKVK